MGFPIDFLRLTPGGLSFQGTWMQSGQGKYPGDKGFNKLSDFSLFPVLKKTSARFNGFSSKRTAP
jgi:hypothetical protein